MKRRSFYVSSFHAIMLSLVATVFVSANLSGCERSAVHEPDETRLKERVLAANEAFLNLRLNEFVAIRSERQRRELLASEKEKVFQEWKTFARQEKPTSEPTNFAIVGRKATVTMKVSVRGNDGQRKTTTLYDLWIFENGDWFLDDADRVSPEYFPKE